MLAAVVGIVAAAVSVVAAPPPPARAAGGFDPSFPRVGVINYSNCVPTCATAKPFSTSTSPRLHFVNPDRRELYAYMEIDQPRSFPRGIAVVDVDRLVQSAWIDLGGSKIPSNKFGVATYDAASHRMFLGEQSDLLGCNQGSVATLSTCGNAGRIAVVDMNDPTANPVVFSLPPLPPVTTGSGAPPDSSAADTVTGLTIDSERQRLYVVTASGGLVEFLGQDPRPVSIVAYDATTLSSAPRPLWTYRIRSCGNVVRQRNLSAYVDVTQNGQTIYFACRGVSGSSLPHGIVRLHMHPSATADPTANFDAEFVPFAGDLAKGFTTGDTVNDRLGVGVASASGQRMYVYDARNGAWTASMLMGAANVGGAGVDPVSGRLYVLNQFEGVRAVDAAALPAILGKMIGLEHEPGLSKDPVVDPVTRRFFEHGPGFQRQGGGGTLHPNAHMWVFEDRTEPYTPPPPPNPDLATNDIEEALAEQVSHTGFGSAYGARAMWVGGIDSIPVAGGINDGIPAQFEAFKLSGGDRGLYLSQVAKAELSGESDRGEASGEAVGARMDEATADDLEAKYGQITAPFQIGGDDAPACDPRRPGRECLAFDSLTGNVGQLSEARCNDFGGEGDPTDAAKPGSSVKCRRLDTVSASASASAAPPAQQGAITFSVASSRSQVDVVKVPTGGVNTVATAVARGVSLQAIAAGTLRIGEITQTATTAAAGRIGSATSTLDTTVKNVQIQDAQGTTVFSCGVPGVDSKNTEEGERCEPLEVVRAINRHLAPHVVASPPRRNLDPTVTGSTGGARAIVTKDPYAFWNDVNVNGDSRKEVVGLELTTYHDTNAASRMKLQLAAVYAESQYQIGSRRPPVVIEPTKLSVSLADDSGTPLAGGAFQVRRASADPALPGEVVATCRTGDDGIGNCEFEDVPPGDYVVAQLAAPPGYARAADAEVTVEPQWHTTVEFTNLRAIGSISISLHSDDNTPLAGSTFELLADNGDLTRGAGDQSVGSCTTDLDGRCGFDEVPLGAYVVHQSVAPTGYLVADDAGFALTQPGQAAELAFITGLEGIAGSGSEDPPSPPSTDTARVDAPTETTEVDLRSPETMPQSIVSSRPLSRPPVLQRLAELPGEVLQFLRRKPGQAVLFALVWLLLGSPLYLATRRRSLTLAKVSI